VNGLYIALHEPSIDFDVFFAHLSSLLILFTRAQPSKEFRAALKVLNDSLMKPDRSSKPATVSESYLLPLLIWQTFLRLISSHWIPSSYISVIHSIKLFSCQQFHSLAVKLAVVAK